MKKKLSVLATAMAMTMCVITGCSSTQAAPQTQETQEQDKAAEEVSVATEEKAGENGSEQMVGMANPWVEITEEEANTLCERLFKAPEGAEGVTWHKCEALGDPDNYVGPMVQLNFTMDGTEFTARAQQGASEDTDIAGNYVTWTVGPEDVTLANWGEGHMTGKTYRSIEESGYVDLITWYDIEIGISYELTAIAKDLDGFDIQAVAEQMYKN